MGSTETSLELRRAEEGGFHRPLRITFVVTGLDVGGAEMMLWKLISGLDRRRFEPYLLSLNSQATYMLPAFERLGVRCRLLEGRPDGRRMPSIRRLAEELRSTRPDVIQAWMYHANIAATLAAAWARLDAPVLWNIRATLMERKKEKRLTAAVIWLGGKLSFAPARIINNSRVSALEHERRLGYRAAKRVILPNGFDTQLFRPDRAARERVRGELGVGSNAILVGLAARYHPMKDHEGFLRAAKTVKRRQPDAHFVLAGLHVEPSNADLASMIEACGLTGSVSLLGHREDMHAIYPALDVLASSSSSGEGFPNVIGEAMSCGVPCVVTDVGDSADIVGDTGRVVPPREPEALAEALLQVIELTPSERAALGQRARERAAEHFSLAGIVEQYQDLYMQVHQQRRQA